MHLCLYKQDHFHQTLRYVSIPHPVPSKRRDHLPQSNRKYERHPTNHMQEANSSGHLYHVNIIRAGFNATGKKKWLATTVASG
jgi:hypothetical protein